MNSSPSDVPAPARDGPAGDLTGLLLGGTAIAVSLVALARPLRIAEVQALTPPLLRRFGPRGRHRGTGGTDDG
ncbi:hypothetical protein AB0O76_17690 [Streptomyces sp. NPDC086554]|uniref:hypothetical protein n=1 Tax=Streptomyces sp. NPDC086554 TaxID=3154864 RepID=UPI00343E9D27